MKTLWCLGSMVVLLALPVFARMPMSGVVTSTFDVKATVDSFVGKAVSEPVTVNPGDARISVTFLIDKMETGKKKRDKEMQHMFHSAEFPVIVGSVDAASVLNLDSANGSATVLVDVVMHGVTNEVNATITNVTRTEEAVGFDMNFPLVLSRFGLKAPSVMMVIRVADEVQVSSHVALSTKAE